MMLSAGAMAAPAITVSRDIDKMEDVTLKDTPWFLFIKTTEYFSGQTLQLYQAGSYRYLCWKAAMKQKQRKNVSISCVSLLAIDQGRVEKRDCFVHFRVQS